MNLELQSALSEKSSQFGHGDISLFKTLVQQHVADTEKKMASMGKTGPNIQAAQLERQAYELALSNVLRDCDVFKVWFTRNKDQQSAVFFQELQHRLARKNAAKQVAKNVTDRSSSVWKVSLSTLGSPTECMQQFHAMRSQVMKLESLSQKDQILTLIILNWAAPSCFTSQEQHTQAAVCGALVNSEGGFGGVLTPVYFHKKGHLYRVEESANKLLSNGNLNTDGRWAMPFSGKNDDREKRTLVQPGRFLLPMEESACQSVCEKWRAVPVPLMKKPLLEESQLTLTRDMLQIEDVSPDALPATTYMETHVNAPEKHQQIGLDAARKCLRGFLQGLEPPTGARSAVMVVDLSAHTAEFLKASVMDHTFATSGLPLYYLGFAGGDEKMEWATHHFESWMTDGLLDGSVPLPKSVTLPGATLPPDMVEAPPAQPQLNVLTWNKTVKYQGLPTLKVPAALLTKYHDHPRFGSEFQAALEKIRSELPVDMVEDKSGSGSSGKRGLLGPKTEPGMQPAKKETSAAAVKFEAHCYCLQCQFRSTIFVF